MLFPCGDDPIRRSAITAHQPSRLVCQIRRSCLTRVLATLLALNLSPVAAQFYEKVHSFTDAQALADNKGHRPEADLILDGNGSLYGTTKFGGAADEGTVFQLTPSGELTTLVEFDALGAENTKGGKPDTRLVRGNDGNLYGTTSGGGFDGLGTVFKITPSGDITRLFEFRGGIGNSGARPNGLVLGRDGNLYGTTETNGGFASGTVFRISTEGELTTLINFTGDGVENRGREPDAALVEGVDGDLYGTTRGGGANDLGTIFKMSPSGQLVTLVEFTGTTGQRLGAEPRSALVQANDGNFYGTTFRGGVNDLGTLFRVTPGGQLTTLVEFSGNTQHHLGSFPRAGLIQGGDGYLFGTTTAGGSDGFGTIFKVTLGGTMTTLVEFPAGGESGRAELGNEPVGGLVQALDGNLYGTTGSGGLNEMGTLFRMSPSGELDVVIHYSGTGGGEVDLELIEGSDGNLYGTTRGLNPSGTGFVWEIFKLAPSGEVTPHFTCTHDQTQLFGASLLPSDDGSFIGTTVRGGSSDNGSIFRIDPDGNFTTLIDFTGVGGANPGSSPLGGLVGTETGVLLGSTRNGGEHGLGTIYALTSGGHLTTLVNFTGNGPNHGGRHPTAGVIRGIDGNFYGTTGAGGATDHGTIFRLTPSGDFTTLVEFTRNGLTNRGAYPETGLTQGADGNFYGITSSGGLSDMGTLFRVTPGGILTTVAEIDGTVVERVDALPRGPLRLGGDGNLYGTTSSGGTSNKGTIFQVTPTGLFTKIYDFGADGTEGNPGRLTRTSTGDLYGTARSTERNTSGFGSIYRLISPGSPTISLREVSAVGTNTATLSTSANARGFSTAVRLEFGTDGQDFSNHVQLASNLSGLQTTTIGTSLTELASGTRFFYRFRATSAVGESLSRVASFRTLAVPIATVRVPSDVDVSSATLKGVVNSSGSDTSVLFDLGTDPNFFSRILPGMPDTISSDIDTDVSASVAGLEPGATYYYRIRATNAGGTTVSGSISFRTLTAPITTIGGAKFVTSSSALVEGLVHPFGSETQIVFEYGTDGVDFPHSTGAMPNPIDGNEEVPVSAQLTGLDQGDTIYYRIRATSPGGVGLSEPPRSFVLDVLSGFEQRFPDSPEDDDGFVVVTLSPNDIGTGWRFAGEQAWRLPGVPATGLTTDDREIEFRPIPGFRHPDREFVSVISGAAATFVDGEYVLLGQGTPTGELTVQIAPQSVTLPELPVEERAQWRLLGEGGESWRESEDSIDELFPGDYLVELKPLPGRSSPAILSVVVRDGGDETITATYRLADPIGGASPEPLSFDDLSVDESFPYAYVGQLRSDVAVASGIVVRKRVVATAAHAVFDDAMFEFVTGLNWNFQRDRNTHEPVPLSPRGIYVMSGYADARLGQTPGEGTSESQNQDAAALYFLEDAGRGGFSGFLASDRETNEFLTSAAQKVLVGYPVDGITAENRGRMHATPAGSYTFSKAYGRTYATTDLSAPGGTSGGPLCVQFGGEGGSYYPAAIYVGGSGGQTVVRAIDSEVIGLFNAASNSSNGGGNGTGYLVQAAPTSAPEGDGALKVTTNLPGSRWQFDSNQVSNHFRASATTYMPGRGRTLVIDFEPVEGFLSPPRQVINLSPDENVEIEANYVLVEFDSWMGSHDFEPMLDAATEQERSEQLALMRRPSSDPDGDGLINLLEFAFNLNPMQHDEQADSTLGASGVPRLVSRNPGSRLEFVRRKASPGEPGLSYSPCLSPDLANWAEIDEGDLSVEPIDGSPEIERVTCELPNTEARSQFFRVDVDYSLPTNP